MSITLRTSTDTSTSQTYNYASKSTPLTAEEVDKNFITLKQKCDELATDYTTTFNTDGSLKDGSVAASSLADSSVTGAKLKDRAVSWDDQRNVLYLTDTSVSPNKIEGTVNNYLANTSLTSLPSGTVIYIKSANENTSSTTLTVKDQNTTSGDITTILSEELFKQKDTSLASGDVRSGGIYVAVWDGSSLQLANTLQEPKVEVKETISRVQTFGPVEFPLSELPSNGTEETKSHGLGAGVKPTTFTAMLECTNNDAGRVAGDMIPLEQVTDASGDHHGVLVSVQNANVKAGKSQEALKIPDTANSGVQAINNAKWKVVVRGTYQNDSTYSPAYVDRALTYPAYNPSSALTVGNYLYIFASHGTCPIYKINLITNKVILISNNGSGRTHMNASLIKHSDDAEFRAGDATISAAGSGYAVGDVVRLNAGTPKSSDNNNHAKYVVKTITGGGSTGPVGSLYELSDTATANSSASAGLYTTPPDVPCATAAVSGSGSNLTLTVNFSSVATSRIYWTSNDTYLRFLEPNGKDNAEVPNTSNQAATDHDRWPFSVADFSGGGDYYGFQTHYHKDYPADLGGLRTYEFGGSWTNGYNFLNAHAAVKNLEGGVSSRRLEGVQWNPVKRRLYCSSMYSNLMHIFTLSGTGEATKGSLQSAFTANNIGAFSYTKTIGIPGGGGYSQGGHGGDFLNSIHVDWDVDTGDEKSITIAKYSANGTVTRAAWKED